MKTRIITIFVAVVLSGTLFTGCTVSSLGQLGKEHVRISTVETDWLKARLRFTPIARQINKTLGMGVDILSDWDTESIKVHLADESVKNYYHLLYLDPIQFCQLSGEATLTPLAVRRNLNGQITETGLIVVPKKSQLKAIKNIQGKRFAFGPYGSPYLFYNVLELLRDSKVPISLVKCSFDSPNSVTVARRLLLGWSDVGVVTKTWWETTNDKTLDFRHLLKDKLTVIGETKPLTEYMWVATDALTKEQQQQVKKLLTAGVKDKPKVVSPFSAKEFVPADEKAIKELPARIKRIRNVPPKPTLLPL